MFVRTWPACALLAAVLGLSACSDWNSLSRCFAPGSCVDGSAIDAPVDSIPDTFDPCPGNLIRNPGFEEPSGTDWIAENSQLQIDTVGADPPSSVMRVCNNSVTQPAYYAARTTEIVNPTQGSVYRLSGQVRTETSTTQLIRVEFQEPTFTAAGSVLMNVGPTWKFLTADYTVQGNASASIRTLFTSKNSPPLDSCFDFDNACLQKIN